MPLPHAEPPKRHKEGLGMLLTEEEEEEGSGVYKVPIDRRPKPRTYLLQLDYYNLDILVVSLYDRWIKIMVNPYLH
jgi:hypothetical protein